MKKNDELGLGEKVCAFIKPIDGAKLSHEDIVAPDVGGFIVTRLFTPFLLGAIHMLEDGIATRDEIDQRQIFFSCNDN